MASLDRRGRVSNADIPRVLGWSPSTSLTIVERESVIVVRAPGQVRLIHECGYLYLPSRHRKAAGIRAGHRVLLAADLANRILLVYPPTALDRLLTGHFATVIKEVR
ncbi:AbrB/MazE/SpoVT family DNA-binding domain-containing protein [Nocardia cyriacigeorgica]|uniref:AbrB/MazE/SpoVT family DNA-binding domain-containing protein n=2 Tax=Nocardia cyriacigeorgica TaxID=135487 RepID=A0A4U8VWZ1_9NOCA|nr:AbrB/MazE/SpoVT family DNA-binding domain-containing protein [Nocardia cyriacigeorgica]MBF6161729.1 AbrB/MazE/SpoVT family DNA-binding domain-containing protein [Nocardia cyriacigeorgica]MBF6200527.1 AbrB/MazE/SpoVT family DNA-binding domain-containing protein [Nocardia cyriacigeorgica]MBF6532205.1 AbrB/MazE/SpoVT family DNA-binding domain-containing protein [Nocardia cyriacigeorgica]VFA98031.1 Uncharacterised protein [Nocardia cyriacigeorgica]